MSTTSRRLKLLCPQEYVGVADMRVVRCNRCTSGWSKAEGRCTIDTGAEHLSTVPDAPACPIQDRCQHQVQSSGPCTVRSRGLICESALRFAGVPDPEDHPLSFNAAVCA